MSLFRYSARKLTGELVEGESAARSRRELSDQLSADGLVLVDARAIGSGFDLSRLMGRSRNVKLGALMTFVREFRALIGAGMPVARALALLEARKDDQLLGAAVAAVRVRVERGEALDQAMASHPQVFDSLVRATVRAGNATGRLEEALDRLLGFLTLRHQLRRKINRALAYPVFLLVLLAVVLALLMLFVLPRFAELYEEFGADLPWMTQILMTAVRAAPVAIPVGLAAIFCFALLARAWASRPAARLGLDALKLRLPITGRIARDLGLVQISFMMSLLLRAGMPVREALDFAAASLPNRFQAQRLERVAAAVTSGRGIGDALSEQALYPDLSQSLLVAGEAAGDLDRLFGEVAKLHEDALEDRLARVIALIEPAMMLVVGIVLGAVIVAVYLPIFGISSVIE